MMQTRAPPCTRSTSRSHLPTTSRSQPRILLGNKSCHARWTGLWSRSWPRLALGEKLTEPISNSCSKKGPGPGSTLFQTMPWASMWSLPSSEPWSACGFACLLPILTWLAPCVMALQIASGTTPVCAPAGATGSRDTTSCATSWQGVPALLACNRKSRNRTCSLHGRSSRGHRRWITASWKWPSPSWCLDRQLEPSWPCRFRCCRHFWLAARPPCCFSRWRQQSEHGLRSSEVPPLGHVAGLCHWGPAIHSPCGRSLRWRLGAHRFENVEVPLGRYRCQDKWKQLRGTAALAPGPRHCVAPGECQGHNAATRVKHHPGPSVTSP